MREGRRKGGVGIDTGIHLESYFVVGDFNFKSLAVKCSCNGCVMPTLIVIK